MMTPEQYNLALLKLGLTASEAGRLLGYSRSTSYRYTTGERPVPRSVELMLKAIFLGNRSPERWVGRLKKFSFTE